ncbi:uncharacterized protein LOC115629636 [Scaptodrosophila lebanonensis]|uniref:Uncharacterized protein LOC115629636 n=1 Tax=Drosophila lebanonensis TaxID=7225 RepID=A0A6J2U4D8_DROLE|nr:uncharacterized protein LOC115629636 [Scaptodrosophila lebanonensis]
MEMLGALLMPKFPPNDRYMLGWTRSSLGYFDEDSLLMMLVLFIFAQLLILIYIFLACFQLSTLHRKHFNEKRRRQFANFIFRRLLMQLERAVGQCRKELSEKVQGCKDTLDSCTRWQIDVLEAINLFRRDATKVLYPKHELHTLATSCAYFVLEEEDQELQDAGYATVNVEMDDAFLRRLLHGSVMS